MCYSTCLLRYYPDNNKLTCSKCPYDCYICNNDSTCIACNALEDFREIDTTTNRCIAKQGYFDNSNVVCVPCPSICMTCSSLTNCSACNKGYYLRIDAYCYTTCLDRYFANDVNNTCTNCPYSCLTCSANGDCLTCDQKDYRVVNKTKCVPIDGYYDNFTQISLKCPETCAFCMNASFCIVCLSGNYLNTENICNSKCPVRYYGNT